MKTNPHFVPRLLALTAFAVGLSHVATAQSSPARPVPVAIDQVADFTYVVKVSNPQQLPGQIKILRASNSEVLYWGTTKYRPSFGEKLNLSNLKDDQYTLVVTVGKDVHRYSIDMNTVVQRTARLGTITFTAMAN